MGHGERKARKNKINNVLKANILQSPTLDENMRVLVKKGPVSVETSFKELEENYASKPGWKMIEEGGVLSIPVEEFRMIDLQKPKNFGKTRLEKGTKI